MRAASHRLFALTLLLPAGLAAQRAPGPGSTLKDQLDYLVGQASGGFAELRGDSIGPKMWRGTYRIPGTLDSATAMAASSITELDRQHADGRPGKAVIGMFPLALVAPGDSVALARYRSSGKTASGEMLVTLSITVQPDNRCS